MMNNQKIRVAFTHGDTNGIGYELIFKAFSEPDMFEICTPIIYGSPKIAAYHCNALGLADNLFSIINNAAEAKAGRLNLIPAFDEEIKVELGVPTQEGSRAAVQSIDRAITDYKDGLYDVLITCPIDKNNMHIDGFSFPCNEKFIETCIGDGKKGLPILINDRLRMVLMTDDISLKNVSEAITQDAIIAKPALLFTTLRRDFRISNPRIAVLALNPNSTAGHPGKEEAEAIIPAVQALSDVGVQIFGPYQADNLFGSCDYMAFDGIIAMYHDQGIIPFKALDSDSSICYLSGLPLVSASPDLTPCFDIAGQGKAHVDAFRKAIYQAIDSFRNRKNYDEPYANPLPKLYHERRDESEKVRFSIPRKRDGNAKESQG